MTNGDIYYASKYADPITYSKNLPTEVAESMRKGGINPQEVASVNIKEDPQKSPFDSALKRVLELRNNSGNLTRSLFSKIYSDKIISSLKERLSTQQMKDTAQYQFNQMKFWNFHWLPAPMVFAYNEENLETPIYEIISEYWEGPSHDIDHIAIYTNTQKYNAALKSTTTREEEKASLYEKITKLEEEEENLINSRLKTINEFSAFITPNAKKEEMKDEKDRKLYVFTPQNKIESNIQKSNDMLKWILFYNSLIKGELKIDDIDIDRMGKLSMEDIIKKSNISAELRNKFSKCAEVMKEVIPVLTYAMADEKTWVYRQGDESLHHFKTHKFDTSNSTQIVKAGIFDACKTRWGNINEGKAKTLLNPLTYLDYYQTREFVNSSLQNERQLMKKYSEDKNENLDAYYRKINDDEEFKIFNLIGFYELEKMIGRKAKDLLYFPEKYQNIFKNSAISYKNINNLNIPETNITYDFYEANEFIKTGARMMEERFDAVRSDKYLGLDDNQKYALKSFSDIFQSFLKPPRKIN